MANIDTIAPSLSNNFNKKAVTMALKQKRHRGKLAKAFAKEASAKQYNRIGQFQRRAEAKLGASASEFRASTMLAVDGYSGTSMLKTAFVRSHKGRLRAKQRI